MNHNIKLPHELVWDERLFFPWLRKFLASWTLYNSPSRWSLVITSHSPHSQEQNFSVQQLIGGEEREWKGWVDLRAVCLWSEQLFQLCFFYQSPPNLLRPVDTSKNWTPRLIRPDLSLCSGTANTTRENWAASNWLKVTQSEKQPDIVSVTSLDFVSELVNQTFLDKKVDSRLSAMSLKPCC